MLKQLALSAIRRYQKNGGAKAHFNLSCNFSPSCSEYTHQAIEKFGLYQGIKLGFNRIRRCNDPDCVTIKHDPLPEGLTMDTHQLKQQEEQLRSEINQLTSEQRKHYYQQEKIRIKDPDTYAVLNWFCAAGLHHFYLGNYPRGAINFLLMLCGLLFIESFGIFLILLVLLMELPQLFKSQQIIHKYNNQVMQDILLELTQSDQGKHSE